MYAVYSCGFNPTLVRFCLSKITGYIADFTSFNPTLVRFCRAAAVGGGIPVLRFNPTLVRFCHRAICTLTHTACGFNPTLVRFCRTTWRQTTPNPTLFQSHLGSILPDWSLTSIRSLTAVSIPPWFDFAGRPRQPLRPHVAVSIPPWFDFARQAFKECIDITLFQSHLGSILPIKRYVAAMGLDPVSIPPWFDFAVCTRGASAGIKIVSIPPWFDFATTESWAMRYPSAVSIPPWFDFALSSDPQDPVLRLLFQSHLGSILPVIDHDCALEEGEFQSHLGSILPVSYDIA